MENPDKRPWREITKTPWFPRDGGPPLPEIPEHVREQISKERERERSGGGQYIRGRLVGAPGQEFGFELLDHPDAGTAWVDLGPTSTEAREGKQG